MAAAASSSSSSSSSAASRMPALCGNSSRTRSRRRVRRLSSLVSCAQRVCRSSRSRLTDDSCIDCNAARSAFASSAPESSLLPRAGRPSALSCFTAAPAAVGAAASPARASCLAPASTQALTASL
eukprot:3591312-Pleurochrysis_carterae.AAC.1